MSDASPLHRGRAPVGWASGALLLLSVACGPPPLIISPTSEAQSVVLIGSYKSGLEARGVDLEEGAAAVLSFPKEPDEFIAAFYPGSLAELGLSPGAFQSSDAGVNLPAPLQLLGEAPGQGLVEMVPPYPRLFSDFKIPAPGSDGCYQSSSCRVGLRCISPCPTGPPVQQVTVPIPPQMLPCPTGWDRQVVPTRVLGHDLSFPLCEPPPSSCAGDEVPFVAGGCAAIDSCDGPGVTPQPGTLFVAVGGTGNGKPESPLGSISEAVLAGASTIALGLGEFDYAVSSTRSVAIVGTCARKTRVRVGAIYGGPAFGPDFSVSFSHCTLVPRNAASPLLRVTSVALALRSVEVRVPIQAEGAEVLISRALLKSEKVSVNASSRAQLVDVISDGARVNSDSTSAIDLKRVRISNVRSWIALDWCGSLRASELVVEDCDYGLSGRGDADLQDVVVQRISGQQLSAIYSTHRLALRRVLVRDVAQSAIQAGGDFVGSDVVVRNASEAFELHGEASLARVFAAPVDQAIYASSSMKNLSVADFIAEGSYPAYSTGVMVRGGATLTRVALERFDYGLNVIEGTAALQDLSFDTGIRALETGEDSSIDLDRFVAFNQRVGIRSLGSLRATNVAISNSGTGLDLLPAEIVPSKPGSLILSHFSIENGSTGIELAWPSSTRVSDGVVYEMNVGLRIAASGISPSGLAEILDRVDLTRVDQRVELVRP